MQVHGHCTTWKGRGAALLKAKVVAPGKNSPRPLRWSFTLWRSIYTLHKHETEHNFRHRHPRRFDPSQRRDRTHNMPATTAETLSIVNRTVSVAPLVLLSAADHYGRSAKGTRKRVVGVLLGQNDGKSVRVSNSFAGAYSSARWRGGWGADQPTQFPSKKTRRTLRSGSWTTTTSRA